MPATARRPLDGLRVLDLTDLGGALGARLLADLGAEVVRVVTPGDPPPPTGDPASDGAAAREWFFRASRQSVALDPAGPAARERLRDLLAGADVLLESSPPDRLALFAIERARLAEDLPALVHVALTPFGRSGPRAAWRGSDLVCAAAAGMVFVNGHPGSAPVAPFGLAAYVSAGVFAAIAALLGLRRRRRGGRGATIDMSVQAATAAAVEHVTGFHRQTGAIESRRGTLHWSRSFRIARCRDGEVLLCLLGDWTTLVEWVTSAEGDTAGEADLLRSPRFAEVDARKAECEPLFDRLDRWAAERTAAEIAETAQALRLPFARVRAMHELSTDPQLAARGLASALASTAASGGEAGAAGGPHGVVLPGPPFRLSAASWAQPRPPAASGHAAATGADRGWKAPRASGAPRQETAVEPAAKSPSAPHAARTARDGALGPRPLAGVTVLDFTWVVAGPVATRILADHGARVVKVERKNAADFGSRRGGLSGNLNRGKESIVLDLARPSGVEIARRLAASSDVVIDNFSARVMRNLGLDHASLRAAHPGVIAVSMSGFGHSGPWRDHVSYGPTLQALVGYPGAMRHPGGPSCGWGYSWSDMAAGMMAALATLVALEHRERTGEGQWVDLGQYETLVALLGPAVFAALAGHEIEPVGNASQEGPAVPHGIYRAAPVAGAARDSAGGNDRWVAIAVLDDAAWARLAALLAADGEAWAEAADLAPLAGREARAAEIDAALARWTRARSAEEVQERLQAAGIAAALVASGADVCRDPQLAARGFFRTVRSPEGGDVTFDGLPFAGSALGSDVLAPGPLLGEHSDVVLRELLGMTDGERRALRDEGVIA